ncbi:F-box/FBD/LRR-repeat protein-like protein [Tanacetum coccineum]
MKAQRLCLDIISTLPRELIENILTLLPIRDALRTSILSRKWRYCWASIPKLVFNDKLFLGYSYENKITNHELANAIFHVLLLHNGPLEEFSLSFELLMVPAVDQIILYLSRKNPLKRFKLENRSAYHYKLASSFFSLQGLEYLAISGCFFELPLTFNGFSKLL